MIIYVAMAALARECLITPHLRAKSRLRRLRSETHLRAQSRGEGAPKGREWNAGDNPPCDVCKDLLKLFVLLSLFLRITSDVPARIPLPTSLRSATFSPGEGSSGAPAPVQPTKINDNLQQHQKNTGPEGPVFVVLWDVPPLTSCTYDGTAPCNGLRGRSS